MKPKPKLPAPLAFIPLADRILVRPLEKKEAQADKMIGGIYFPANTQASTLAQLDNVHSQFDVLAVGSDCKIVQAGSRVVIRNVDCFPCKVGDVEHVLCREANVVAVLA